jgi:heme oxygenase
VPTFDLHTLLREGSVSFHRRLDALPQMMRLLSPQLSTDQYLACLRGLQQAHVPLEQAVEAYLASHSQPFDFAPRRKAALIGRDIAFYSPNERPIAPQLSGQSANQRSGQPGRRPVCN